MDKVITETTEARCPTGSKGLLGKLVGPEGNLPQDLLHYQVELYCRDCTKQFRQVIGASSVLRVVHLYTVDGLFVKSKVQFRDGADHLIDPATQVRIYEMAASFTRR